MALQYMTSWNLATNLGLGVGLFYILTLDTESGIIATETLGQP
jgi:hypothetical protein